MKRNRVRFTLDFSEMGEKSGGGEVGFGKEVRLADNW